jgi:hypothetical protein
MTVPAGLKIQLLILAEIIVNGAAKKVCKPGKYTGPLASVIETK